MTSLTPAMQAALAAQHVIVAALIKIEFPGFTLRLLDGSIRLSFGGEDYLSRDPIYGTLGGVDQIDDGTGDEAPGLSITLLPPSNEAAAAMCAPGVQGAPVHVWLAAVVRETGLIVPDPVALFLGEVDVPTWQAGEDRIEIELECVSAMERLFDNDEGARLTDTFHQSVWSGETGLKNVTAVTKKVYWGTEGAGGAVTNI